MVFLHRFGILYIIPGYLQLVKEYVRCINEGAVPCIESTIELMKRNQCKNASSSALELYKEVTNMVNRNMFSTTKRDSELIYE